MKTDNPDRAIPPEDRNGAGATSPRTLRRLRHARPARPRICDDDGQTLVEFAMVLPILLIVLTGIFAFGIILNQYEILTNAVSSGARAAAMSESGGKSLAPNQDPCQYAVTGVQNSSTTLNTANLTLSVIYTVATTNTSTTYTYPTTCSGITMTPGDTVQVKAQYSVTPVMMGWTSGPITLTSQATEYVQ